jgi:hypothetical protein
MVNIRRNKGAFLKIVTSAPTTADLKQGEYVFCTADNKMYFKDETNTVLSTDALT